MSELEYIKKYQFDFISLRLQVAAREKGFEMSKRGTSGTCARQRSLDFAPAVSIQWVFVDGRISSDNFRKFPGLKTNAVRDSRRRMVVRQDGSNRGPLKSQKSKGK
jgi:hypothetical protein